ncbi:MAG: large extracellular alpha-helical protein, partial [Halothiobacillaceae bacterium]
WVTIGSGSTDSNGAFTWQAPGYDPYHPSEIRRLVVRKEGDTLVLDPNNGPEQFANNQWSSAEQSWLGWTTGSLQQRAPQPEALCHLFTERPLYKPEEEVHLKGYLRRRFENRLAILEAEGEWVITGPGEREWRYPLQPTAAGSVYQKFAEEKLPTGRYTAQLELKHVGNCGSVTFEKEAYRVPTFEVQLHADDMVSLDKEFKVTLSSRYYAGGQVVERPVRWRATQFPYSWTPEKREGFYYSSDGRFAGREPFRSSAVLQQEGTTDAQGAAVLTLNPTAEPTAQPRSYIIEATVTGADDQTVSATYEVHALPPLVLGLKAPRYLEQASSVTPEILVAGPDGKLLAGQSVKVKLLKRQWHSHLQAGDFTQNSAKYVTEVVDETISRTTVTSQTEPLALPLTLQGAGVYIVELEAQDRLGRTQVVSVDFYAGGTEPQTWSQPPTKIFKVTPDRKSYVPGDTAHLILESPYQQAHALAIIETAEGNRYQWLEINNGAATFDLPIELGFTPRLPIHFVLLRGRIAAATTEIDLGKPATLAATTWVEVEPIENRLEIKLTHAAKAQPGDNLDIDIQLRDPSGQPLAGEVTLWLVDQAVLALGKEQRLDPLPDFITNVISRLVMRDTRNLAFGYLPFAEQPGGDAASRMKAEAANLMDNVSVRRNFKTVPYYNPVITVGVDGHAKVTVALPDNLTVFKIRAKAASGAERLGFAKSDVAVRLPVLVQPALPRFVRPGDEFVATAIGRIVEGDLATVKVAGLELQESATQAFDWQANQPQKLRFNVKVPSPSYDAHGKLSRNSVSFTAAVERHSDKARDAFEVALPLQPDRSPVINRSVNPLAAGDRFKLPAIAEAIRPGTLRRSLLLSDQPGLIRMAAGLNYLLEYPHGCTEQRISRARAFIAMERFRNLVIESSDVAEQQRVINQTLEWLVSAVDGNGLTGYWPGSQGYVSLTAWSLLFIKEAADAGYPIDAAVQKRMIEALRQSLRSDYRLFITGESYTERTMALWALATTGNLDAAYAAELARKADYLNLESLAQVIRVLQQSNQGEELITQLNQRLWSSIVFRLHQGKELYGGLQEQASSRNALVLPSEARTLAEVLHTLQQSKSDNPRLQTLLNALVTLGQGDGWGSTNATVSALLTLNDFVADDPTASGKSQAVNLQLDGKSQTLQLGSAQHLVRATSIQPTAIEVELPSSATTPIAIRSESRYLPVADGAQVEAKVNGFAVRRELLRWLSDDEPLQRLEIGTGGQEIALKIGDVIEEHLEVVNGEDRTYVAVVVPLAAGLEPLNPHLATAPAEAKAKGEITLAPTYAAYLDDQVTFYYDSLPKGNYHFYFRTRATIEGRFIQPAAFAEKMYEQAVNGNSAGVRVVVRAK